MKHGTRIAVQLTGQEEQVPAEYINPIGNEFHMVRIFEGRAGVTDSGLREVRQEQIEVVPRHMVKS